jgi:hypothetical protein
MLLGHIVVSEVQLHELLIIIVIFSQVADKLHVPS